MPEPTQLRALASIVEDLTEQGIAVRVDDIREWDHNDSLEVHLELEFSETLRESEPSAAAADEGCQRDAAASEGQDAETADAGEGSLSCPEAGCDYQTLSKRGLNIHQTKAHGDHDDVWCGVCGDGPFAGKSPLAGHHNGVGHEGDLQPVDEPPADGTTGGGSEDTAPEREFDDVAPDWLDERSFHEAAELCADLEELTTTLGWDDREQLAALVKVTDVDVNVARATGVPDS